MLQASLIQMMKYCIIKEIIPSSSQCFSRSGDNGQGSSSFFGKNRGFRPRVLVSKESPPDMQAKIRVRLAMLMHDHTHVTTVFGISGKR
jgi:hypothetical protein